MLPWELCNKTRFPWVPTLLSPPNLLRLKAFSSRRRSLILPPTSQQWGNSVTEAFVIRGNEPLLITTLIISLIAGIPSFKVIIRLRLSAHTEDQVIVSDLARNKKIQARSPSSFSLHASLPKLKINGGCLASFFSFGTPVRNINVTVGHTNGECSFLFRNPSLQRLTLTTFLPSSSWEQEPPTLS